jgi:adenosylhomocysteine nucleosidase
MPYDERWNGSGRTGMSKHHSPDNQSCAAKAAPVHGPERRAPIAIVAALEREVRPLVSRWRRCTGERGGRRFRFFESDDAVLVCGGMGAEAARRAAEAVIALYAPRAVYSVGFAGALRSGMKVGEVIVPARVINADDGSSVSLASGSGVLVSFRAVASPEQKRKLRQSFGGQAVDMEAAAVAQAAQARGVPFGTMKVISDEVDFEFPEIERFRDAEGRFREARFVLFTSVRPWLWRRVLRMARNAKIATRVLCERLLKIGEERSSDTPDLREATKQP